MIPILNDYNWAEVFGEGTGGVCSIIHPQPEPPSYRGSLATFGREDVAEIHYIEEGERDEALWIICGKLKDGRFFVASAGCCYTGWDCQAGNSGSVSETREAMILFGLTDEMRKRFGIVPDMMGGFVETNPHTWLIDLDSIITFDI